MSPPPPSPEPAHGYRRFWSRVGDRFPDLGGATSTRQYREGEERLWRQFLPNLRGARVLKTDLWDEAKNTRILCWAAEEGALAFGVDIAEPTIAQARRAFPPGVLRATAADVRRLPFREQSFDAIYSMGTIEHFQDSSLAVLEMARVLRPGGRAVVGVPNRWDPFLRPLLVSLLWHCGLYAYGYEKSFSMRALRRLVEAAGLRAVGETGLLFLPGGLRMLELAAHRVAPGLGRLLGAATRPFAWLERRVPRLRRHGYLIAVVAEKPLPPG